MVYQKGDRVRIKRGKYKKNGYGVFIEPYGRQMAAIRVEGDSRDRRNLWLTSIEATENVAEATAEATIPKGGDVVLSRNEYNELLAEIDSLTKSLKTLELKVKKHG